MAIKSRQLKLQNLGLVKQKYELTFFLHTVFFVIYYVIDTSI